MKGGFKPDVIHAHIFSAGVPAILLGKLYGIPVVITEHWHGFPEKKLKLTEKIMAKFAMNRAHWILPVSQSLQRGIEAYGIKGRFQIVPNVVDPFLFHPIQKDRAQGHQKKILFVGLLAPVKGLTYLFQALARLRQQRDDWRLDIVGDGPFRVEYERSAQQLGLVQKLNFHGMKSKREVAEFMRLADLLVLPSLTETFSTVAAEALASGVPVLATRCGGPEDFVSDEVGLLVSPGSEETLYKGLNKMLDHLDHFLPDRLSRYANERFHSNHVGAQLHTLYQQTLRMDANCYRVGYSGAKIFISEGWRVLDVGSGHNPHPRADVLLEKDLEDHKERSGKPVLHNGRSLILGDAQRLPFRNRSFDYAIASQIAEHVLEPMAFCKELQRVAERGYVECPGPIGEILLGEPFHLWIVREKHGKLIFRKKVQQNALLRLLSNFFYALFYAGRDRARRTFKPRLAICRHALMVVALFISKMWCSRWLRRWTYTCFEFSNRFDFEVME